MRLAIFIAAMPALLIVALDPSTDWHLGRGSIQHGGAEQ
jgi:hypothetical protein